MTTWETNMKITSTRRLRAILAASILGFTPALSTLAWATAPTVPTIIWDKYAVPHIYGADIPTVVRGLGYAQMENHAETLLNNVARARGRSAEYFGAGQAGSTFNVDYDMKVWTYGIPQRAALWVAQSDPFQLSVLQAFCDGINEYATTHPTDIFPQLKAILPVVPSDITAGEQNTIWFTFLTETSNLPSQVSAFVGSTGSGVGVSLRGEDGAHPSKSMFAKLAPSDLARLIHSPRAEGSNGWAIAPAKSTDGNAILMGNPHLPWGMNQPIPDFFGNQNFGIYQWIEANLVIGNPSSPTLNASGVTFIGGPFIGVGFSDNIGWTHTNNTIKNADLFQLTLDSTGTKYKFGNVYLPLTHTTHQIKVLNTTTGGYTITPLDIYTSVQGPLVAFNNNPATPQALALRVPGLAQNSLVTQYWNMIQAQNMTQFIAAESALQMPFFNTMAADSSGNIFYLFGGLQPVRSSATTFGDASQILDGTTPSTLWTKTLPFSQLPQALNPPGNFVANSNNPPWTVAFPQPSTLNPANYPAYVAPSTMDFRPQHGATFLVNSGKLTANQVMQGKMSTEMLLADRVLPDLISMANASSDPVAIKAAAILSAWDHTAQSASVGGPLFEQWWYTVLNNMASPPAGTVPIVADTSLQFVSPHPEFRIPWSAATPITTPVGLNSVNTTQLVAALDSAYNTMQTEFPTAGGPAASWGATHFTTLAQHADAAQDIYAPLAANAPNSGPDDEFGPIRVVNDYYLPTSLGSIFGLTQNQYISYGGDGYVQVIEFTPTGSVGGTLLTYGNASRSISPTRPVALHITDQLQLYSNENLKPALRTLSAVQAAAVSTETY